MNNIVLNSILFIYKYGGLDIFLKQKNTKIALRIDEEGKLFGITKRYFDGDLKQENTFTDENTIITYLAEIAYYGLLKNQDNYIEISYNEQNVIESLKLKVSNRIYSYYMMMFDDNHDKIRQIILGASPLEIMINYTIRNNKNDNSTIGIETIKFSLCDAINNCYETINRGKEIWEKLRNSETPEEEEQYGKEWDIFLEEGINIEEFTATIETEKATKKSIDTNELDKIGLTYEFIGDRKYIKNPAVGREEEIRELGSTILTPSYSPLLIGHPGVGKTAIIEGLSYAIQNKQVPYTLINKKILKITPSAIISGCTLVGMFEQKMEVLIDFLKKNTDIILYIDELHTAFGTGSASKNNDILNILKPHIENGSIKMIGATTIYEYDEYLKKDLAFTRRFKLINVNEPDENTLKYIISVNIEKYEKQTGIKFDNDTSKQNAMIECLIDITKDSHRDYQEKRYNPALILSIIQSAFGYALYDENDTVGVTYLSEAVKKCTNLYKKVREEEAHELLDLNPTQQKCKVYQPNFNHIQG